LSNIELIDYELEDMKELKPCKGINKAKNYDGCNGLVKVEYRKYGLCPDCFRLWIQTTEEGLEYALKCIPRAKKQIAKDKKTQIKKQRIENKSIAVLKQEAKQPFQKLIRIRDYRKDCICCDEKLPFEIGAYDGGHYKSAESYSGVIFHPDNCNGQRVYCNQHLHGNEGNYTNGLIKRIGWARYNKLIALANRYKSYKWDRYKLIELKNHYNRELRAVEKGEKDINEVDFTIGIIN